MFKKIFIVLLIIFLTTSCSNNINLNINNIDGITYEDNSIDDTDFEFIKSKINKDYSNIYNFQTHGKKLTIKTKEKNYDFEITNNHIIYVEENKKYFTSSENIMKELNSIITKYNDSSFITIKKEDCHSANYIYRIDNTDNCISINTKLNLYNLNIYQDEVSKNTIFNQIQSNEEICIYINDLNKLHISFENPYKHTFNIRYDKNFIIE